MLNIFNINPLVVFSGESNSGGFAVNADATSPELSVRQSLKIFNNTSLAFEPLQVGVNNLIGHTGLTTNATHGWELQLANKTEAGLIRNPLYLVKTGQGGSVIANWAIGATFSGTNCWQVMQDRIDAAIILRGITSSRKFIMFYSQGINDAIAGTTASTWQTATVAHFTKVRAKYGPVPIVMTQLPPDYSGYNANIASICASDALTVNVAVADLPMRTDVSPNDAHWSYAGMKTLTDRMYAAVKPLI